MVLFCLCFDKRISKDLAFCQNCLYDLACIQEKHQHFGLSSLSSTQLETYIKLIKCHLQCNPKLVTSKGIEGPFKFRYFFDSDRTNSHKINQDNKNPETSDLLIDRSKITEEFLNKIVKTNFYQSFYGYHLSIQSDLPNRWEKASPLDTYYINKLIRNFKKDLKICQLSYLKDNYLYQLQINHPTKKIEDLKITLQNKNTLKICHIVFTQKRKFYCHNGAI